MNEINWCKFFADIEADPEAITPRLTVRQLYVEAKEHLDSCDACFNRSERVIAKAPKDKPDIIIGLN